MQIENLEESLDPSDEDRADVVASEAGHALSAVLLAIAVVAVLILAVA